MDGLRSRQNPIHSFARGRAGSETMIPEKPLPYMGNYSSTDEYIDKLLNFVTNSAEFMVFCGGVHILDFFTNQSSLFEYAVPQEWHPFVLECDIMKLLDLMVREDLDTFTYEGAHQPPESLLQYIRTVRDLSLSRNFSPPAKNLPRLPRTVVKGMNVKKTHEVQTFAGYVTRLSEDISSRTGGGEISHFVDFGSGQNYLGRALASEPYNRNVIAVEGRDHNVKAAKAFDVVSGLAVKPNVLRNKKMWMKIVELAGPGYKENPEQLAKAVREVAGEGAFEFRTNKTVNAEAKYENSPDMGSVQYISGRLDSGDLSEVIAGIDRSNLPEEEKERLNLMAVSIHSCGNLSHHAIRSLLLNEDIRAVAIVGCCYNLLTEKLGPPTFKHPCLRPSLQAVNARVARESARRDPEGFPMSTRFSTYADEGIRLNITARMMACQAVQNWTREESEAFFTRHWYRAVLQKIFLDRGVVTKVVHADALASAEGKPSESEAPNATEEPGALDASTSPVIIGSVPKSSYNSFKTYVRAAIDKLCASSEYRTQGEAMRSKMDGLTDEEIENYEKQYLPRRKEVAVTWSMMAFSAIIVESLIVADRWTFLKEQKGVVDEAWVEPVFDFKQSPRNLVVVGLKK